MIFNFKNFYQPLGILILIGFISGNSLAIAENKISKGCDENILSPFDYRLCLETNISKLPFVVIPYKPNYFIGSYVSNLSGGDEEYQNFETKFQISFKIPISSYDNPTRCLWIENTACITFFGYSQVSVWQMLNFDRSAPFRDSNFEPELMVAQIFNKGASDDWNLRLINYGLINHQSNGNVPPKSRSWNRSYLDFVFEKNNSYISFKAWKRWPEKDKESTSGFRGDDNPQIEKYVGNVQLKYFYASKNNNYSITLRDSQFHPNNVNLQLDWSTPIKEMFDYFSESDLRLYVQYFDGYGETRY